MRAWIVAALVAGGCSSAGEPISADEAAAYDRYRQPEQVIAALALRPGQVVADVGAGRGYLTHRLAAAVGTRGRVVATDVDAAALAELARAPHSAQAAPVEARRVQAADPGLEAHTYDLILLSEVDHLLADRADYLTRLAAALAPGGRIAVVNKLTYRAALLAAAQVAQLTVMREQRLGAFHVTLLGGAR